MSSGKCVIDTNTRSYTLAGLQTPLSSFCDSCCCPSPGLDVVEEVLPALVDLLQRASDLGLLGLVAGQQQLLAQLLQVALVLAEQVDFLHAVLWRHGMVR